MTYSIKNIKTGELLGGPYTEKSSATRAFKNRNLSQNEAYISDSDWMNREAGRSDRINVEQYGLIAIPTHYLHKSDKSTPDELMVSFTETPTKGERNLQASGRKVGRYLAEFYPTLSSVEVARISSEMTSRVLGLGLNIATTAQDIKWVYTHCASGADACMSHPVGSYSSKPLHPVEAYAGPDLAVAYIKDRDNRVTSRVLIWPEKKIIGPRVYGGTADRLRALLKDAGYKSGSLIGARMSLIPIVSADSADYHAYLCPYIDEYRAVHKTADHLIIGQHPTTGESQGATSTSGYIHVLEYISAVSRRNMSRSERMVVAHPESGSQITIHRDEVADFTVTFEGTRFFKHSSVDQHWIEAGDGKTYPMYYVRNNMIQDSISGKYYNSSEMMNVQNLGYVTHNYYMKHCATCDMSHRSLVRTDMKWMEHGVWWSNRYFRDFGITHEGKHYARILFEEKKAA